MTDLYFFNVLEDFSADTSNKSVKSYNALSLIEKEASDFFP